MPSVLPSFSNFNPRLTEVLSLKYNPNPSVFENVVSTLRSRNKDSFRLPAEGWSASGGSSYSKMFYVYVLKSSRNAKRYVGFTSKHPEERLIEHNNGANKFTSRNGPFKLIYSEKIETKTEAIRRENFLKSGQGRKFLDSIPA